MFPFLLIALPFSAPARSIADSKHNLTATGPGSVKAETAGELCIFCHTPHRASKEGPLWNRYSTGASYIPYSSSTVKATIGQPTGASKLCLSCHDGTVALGMVRSHSAPIQFRDGVTTMPAGKRTHIGTDLSDDHPVSFIYDSALAAIHGQLRDPATLTGPVKLDHTGQMQCTSCHDSHNDQYGKFLVAPNTGSALCTACHIPHQWESSSHRLSSATWNGAGPNPWPHSTETTVAANACQNCHTPHQAGTPSRLLKFADEEANCFSCHNGNVAAKNIQADFNKMSIHPIFNTSGVHDPNEDIINSPRHVECVDCHNPHASRFQSATAPNASGALAGVKGVSSTGAMVNPVTREYELCFRCHGDSIERGSARVSRQFPETNTRLEFSPASASYHPVVATGKNPNVPSLVPPWTSSSMMYCTDCHNNDQGPGAGGTGAAGPHGSAFAPILERQMVLTDFMPESSAS
jgi:predicted CXXCH cytochrome family protein